MTRYTDASGKALILREELGTGGEGSVFALPDPTLCAKIYHKPLSSERADKVRQMAPMRSDQLTRLTAWPIGLVSNQKAEAVGLVLPRVTGAKDIHRLYSPKSRRSDFLRADWRFLIRAAANTARAFGAVHGSGCVIGDVNHGSILVAQDATVRLIDCDSFQVEAGGRRFLCSVGVETYTPPELQGKSFEGVIRTSNHDGFGLAVLVFHLLMMGRHPFAGRFFGVGDMPIGKAIEDIRFPYGARRAEVLMDAPPGAPSLEVVGTEVAGLFERAFSRQGVIGGRPSARDWMSGLERLEASVRQCGANQAHWFQRSSASCPWCKLEGGTGVILFPLVMQASAQVGLDLDALMRQVQLLSHPGAAPSLPDLQLNASSEAQVLRDRLRKRNIVAFAVALAAFVGFMAIGVIPAAFVAVPIAFFGIRAIAGKSSDVAAFRSKCEEAETKKDAALKDWHRHAGPSEFDSARNILDAAADDVRTIPEKRAQKLSRLKSDQRRLQLEAYLDRFDLESAKISGIGAARKSALASNNVETAADVTPSSIQIPGFGPTTQKKLLEWRGGLERSFIYDPNKPIDPRDLTRVEQEILTERKKAEDALRGAFGRLQQTHAQITSVRQNMRSRVEAACFEHAQAKADLDVLS